MQNAGHPNDALRRRQLENEEKFLNKFSLRKFTVPKEKLHKPPERQINQKDECVKSSSKTYEVKKSSNRAAATESLDQKRIHLEYRDLAKVLTANVPWWLQTKGVERNLKGERLVSLVEDTKETLSTTSVRLVAGCNSRIMQNHCDDKSDINFVLSEALKPYSRENSEKHEKDQSPDETILNAISTKANTNTNGNTNADEVSWIEQRLDKVQDILFDLAKSRLFSGCEHCQGLKMPYLPMDDNYNAPLTCEVLRSIEEDRHRTSVSAAIIGQHNNGQNNAANCPCAQNCTCTRDIPQNNQYNGTTDPNTQGNTTNPATAAASVPAPVDGRRDSEIVEETVETCADYVSNLNVVNVEIDGLCTYMHKMIEKDVVTDPNLLRSIIERLQEVRQVLSEFTIKVLSYCSDDHLPTQEQLENTEYHCDAAYPIAVEFDTPLPGGHGRTHYRDNPVRTAQYVHSTGNGNYSSSCRGGDPLSPSSKFKSGRRLRRIISSDMACYCCGAVPKSHVLDERNKLRQHHLANETCDPDVRRTRKIKLTKEEKERLKREQQEFKDSVNTAKSATSATSVESIESKEKVKKTHKTHKKVHKESSDSSSSDESVTRMKKKDNTKKKGKGKKADKNVQTIDLATSCFSMCTKIFEKKDKNKEEKDDEDTDKNEHENEKKEVKKSESKEDHKVVIKEESKGESNEENRKISEEETRKVSKEENRKVSKEENRKVSKEENRKVSKEENKKVSKEENTKENRKESKEENTKENRKESKEENTKENRKESKEETKPENLKSNENLLTKQEEVNESQWCINTQQVSPEQHLKEVQDLDEKIQNLEATLRQEEEKVSASSSQKAKTSDTKSPSDISLNNEQKNTNTDNVKRESETQTTELAGFERIATTYNGPDSNEILCEPKSTYALEDIKKKNCKQIQLSTLNGCVSQISDVCTCLCSLASSTICLSNLKCPSIKFCKACSFKRHRNQGGCHVPCVCDICDNVPIIERDLTSEIEKLIGGEKRNKVFLKFTIATNGLYHIQISNSSNIHLGCLYATEEATIEARNSKGFDGFITLSVIDPWNANTPTHIERLVDHAFMVVQQENRSK